MAASVPASVTGDDDLYKVLLTNRDKFSDLCSLVSQEVAGMFKNHGNDANGEKPLCLTTFQEKFAQVLKANTHFVESSSVFDDKHAKGSKWDFGKEDEQQLNLQEVLLPKLDSLTVNVTKKRRTYPAICSQHLRSCLRARHNKLVQKHRTLSKSSTAAASTSTSTKSAAVIEELVSLASDVAADLHDFKKDSNLLLAKYERLRTTREQLEASERNRVSRKRKQQ